MHCTGRAFMPFYVNTTVSVVKPNRTSLSKAMFNKSYAACLYASLGIPIGTFFSLQLVGITMLTNGKYPVFTHVPKNFIAY